jgi:hypothetical protein
LYYGIVKKQKPAGMPPQSGKVAQASALGYLAILREILRSKNHSLRMAGDFAQYFDRKCCLATFIT